MDRYIDERQEELMDLNEMSEKDRRMVNWAKSEWSNSRPSYIGFYPVRHADLAPFIGGITAFLDVLYYWALRTGRMSLEDPLIQFIVAGLFFMTAYSAGFLGVWYDER